MGDSRLLLVRVWPRADRFRAVVRGVDECSTRLFMSADGLVGYLAALTPPSPAGRDSGTAALTPREREVALLCEQGLTDKQISARLGLATATVRNHVSHCYRKLQVSNRATLGYALRNPAAPQSGGTGACAP